MRAKKNGTFNQACFLRNGLPHPREDHFPAEVDDPEEDERDRQEGPESFGQALHRATPACIGHVQHRREEHRPEGEAGPEDVIAR